MNLVGAELSDLSRGEGDQAVVAVDVFCVSDVVEKHTATALASIAMLSEDVAAKTKSPAA